MGEMLAPAVDGPNSPPTPHDWRITRLGEIAELASGGTPSKSRPEFWKGTIPWASPKDLKRPRLYDAEDHISEAGLEDGSRIVEPGTLFVVVRGMILAKDLPVAIVKVPMAFNQDMKAVIPGPEVDGEFLLYAFQQHKPSLLPEISTSAHGTRRISTSAIESFRFPLPPLPEQRAIAHVLRTVQRAKEATEKVIAATRQLKASMMRHLFTYGPVPVDHAKRVRLRETEIGSIPEHWAVRPLESLAGLVSGGTPSKERVDYWQGPIPWASPKDMKRPRLADTEDHVSLEGAENGSRIVPPGSVFVVIRGMILAKDLPIAQATVPMAFNQDMKAILPGGGLDSDFLLYSMVQHKAQLLPEIGTSAHGTKRISTSAIASFAIPVPPLPEQREIARMLSVVDRNIAAEEHRGKAHSGVFESAIHHLMTGKLRVKYVARKNGEADQPSRRRNR